MSEVGEEQPGRQILHGLIPQDYEHPFDREALNALEGTPGLELLVRKFMEMGWERVVRIQLTGSNLKVTDVNMPEVHDMFHDSCRILNLQVRPPLYTSWQYQVNGFTTGVENPVVALGSGCIDLLHPNELRYVMGHELGHIKSNHVLYRQLALLINEIGKLAFGLGGLLTVGIRLALLHWSRMAEFTADRAGLLACQNQEGALRALMKIAGLPRKHYDDEVIIQSFLQQAREFEDFDYDALDKIAKLVE